MREKYSKYFLLVLLVGLLLMFMYGYFISKPDLEKNGVWVVAYPYATEGGGKGGSVYIKFKYYYKGREYSNKENGFNGRIDKILENKYLLKISSKTPSLCLFTDEYLITDEQIKSAPAEGWKELPEWAKKEKK
ncbi:hypothetical protein JSO59_002385 [Riemerella anatipestifer]|uniref:hypothetical protein n=1 Tax=Riemerella anatipestifer TaxID=34085 RepID=UPI0030BB9382